MKFKRSAMLIEVMITLSCFTFKERYTAMQEGREFDEKIENPYYLLSIFDTIMNTLSKANGKKVSYTTMMMCSSVLLLATPLLTVSFFVSFLPTKDMDVQINGHESIPRLSTLLLRQGTTSLHLPGS